MPRSSSSCTASTAPSARRDDDADAFAAEPAGAQARGNHQRVGAIGQREEWIGAARRAAAA